MSEMEIEDEDYLLSNPMYSNLLSGMSFNDPANR